jgi:Carboxypeptidase regulatory-like domain
LSRLLFLAFTAATVALAQNTASLAGRVTDTTGHPLHKAALTLRNVGPAPVPQPTFTAESGSDGKFSFDGIPPGRYMLTLERIGYLQKSWRSGPQETSSRLTLTVGQHIGGITLAMIRAVTISGKVTDADGDPVAGVQVTLLRRTYEGDAGFMIERSFYTDATGHYQIPDLAAGNYYLSANAGFEADAFRAVGMRAMNGSSSDQLTNPAQPPQYYTTTYYPNTVSIGTGQNDIQDIDIRLRTTPAFQVKGKISGTVAGHPLDQCRVAIAGAYAPGSGGSSGYSGFRPSIFVAKDGTFDFKDIHIAPGSYFLVAWCYQGWTQEILARQPLTVRDRDIDDAVVNLQPLVDLHGTVAIEGQPGVDFSAHSDANPPLTTTMGVGLTFRNHPHGTNGLTARIQSDGSFTISGIAPGTWNLSVGGTPGTYVKSIRLGSREVSANDIQIDATTAATPLQITLSAAMSAITGMVQTAGGAPLVSSVVTIVSVPHEPGSRTMMTGSDRNGRFTIPVIAPGTYRVFAWEDPDTAQRYNADDLAQFQNQSATVTVKENETGQVTLRQIPASTPLR